MMNSFIKQQWEQNKIGIALVLLSILFIAYGEITSTRIFGGSDTEDWSPGGRPERGSTHNRIYHK